MMIFVGQREKAGCFRSVCPFPSLVRLFLLSPRLSLEPLPFLPVSPVACYFPTQKSLSVTLSGGERGERAEKVKNNFSLQATNVPLPKKEREACKRNEPFSILTLFTLCPFPSLPLCPWDWPFPPRRSGKMEGRKFFLKMSVYTFTSGHSGNEKKSSEGERGGWRSRLTKEGRKDPDRRRGERWWWSAFTDTVCCPVNWKGERSPSNTKKMCFQKRGTGHSQTDGHTQLVVSSFSSPDIRKRISFLCLWVWPSPFFPEIFLPSLIFPDIWSEKGKDNNQPLSSRG